MLRKVMEFCRNTRGNVAVTFGLAATVIVALGGGVIDYTKQTAAHSSLQAIADGAVLAGAKQLQLSGTVSGQKALVTAVASNYINKNAKPELGTPKLGVVVLPKKGIVDLTLTAAIKTPFFGLMGLNGNSKVSAKASARVVGGLPLCVLAMEKTGEKAISATGTAKLTATGCTVHSNSSNVKSIEAWGQAELHTGLTCAVGGVDGGGANFFPAAVTDCPRVADPLASSFSGSVSICTANNKVISSGTRFLLPGVYCGGLKITGNANVVFFPGPYVIKDGLFEMTGSSRSKGSDVGFYFTGAGAALKVTGQADVDFSAMTGGPVAGLLMYEDRTIANGVVHEITSPKVRKLVGTIYFPKSEFKVSINGGGNAQIAQESAFTVIIARMLTLNGKSNLVLNTDYAATDVPLPESISRLSGEIVIAK